MRLQPRRLLALFILLVISAACKQKNTSNSDANNPILNSPEVRALSEKINNAPDNARLYFERGRVLHKMEQDTLALNDYMKAATLDSGKSEYFSAVADLMFEHKDINGSLPWIEKAVKLNPQDPQAHLKIAKVFVYTKDYPKAFAEINTVLRQNAMVPEGYFLKGMIYKDLKDTAKSISSFQAALNVDPNYKESQIQLGLLYSAKKNPLALSYYDNAFKLDSSDVFPLYAKGMYYQDQNKYEEAKAEYRNCIEHDRNYQEAYFGMGWILMQQDSLEKARRQFDIVTRLDITNAAAYYNRGLCSELLGKKQEALEDYKQALSFKEGYKEASEGIRRLR
jgi:tetratricopeptide (TPR) repeat protein